MIYLPKTMWFSFLYLHPLPHSLHVSFSSNCFIWNLHHNYFWEPKNIPQLISIAVNARGLLWRSSCWNSRESTWPNLWKLHSVPVRFISDGVKTIPTIQSKRRPNSSSLWNQRNILSHLFKMTGWRFLDQGISFSCSGFLHRSHNSSERWMPPMQNLEKVICVESDLNFAMNYKNHSSIRQENKLLCKESVAAPS